MQYYISWRWQGQKPNYVRPTIQVLTGIRHIDLIQLTDGGFVRGGMAEENTERAVGGHSSKRCMD